MGESVTTRVTTGKALNATAKEFMELLGGRADLAPSNNTVMLGLGDMTLENLQGRNLHFGVREYAMTAICNGLAAIMKLSVIYMMTHQLLELIAAARGITNMVVLRPGDAEEANLVWAMALDRNDVPVLLSLTQQNLAVFTISLGWQANARRGVHIVYQSAHKPEICLIAMTS